MPWASNAELPAGVRRVLPAKAQSIFRRAANGALQRGLQESSAMRVGWTAVKNAGYQKGADGQWVQAAAPPAEVAEMGRFDGECQIIHANEEQRVVYGWARVARTADGKWVLSSDNAGEAKVWQSVEDLERASHLYLMDARGATDAHIVADVAVPVASLVFTKAIQAALGIPEQTVPEGWFVGLKVTSDEVWAKVKDGTYRAFSIGGESERVPAEPGQVG
jgi:cation transport regulator ChaB